MMDRDQLDHILRASQDITNEREFVIVGSQAALAQLLRLPGVMGMSPEIDIYPRNRPELWGEIDGAIGAMSDFASTHGFYADGVDKNTAKFPADWENRAVRYSGPGAKGATATAPEIHDLAAGKLVAGREKDIEWVSEAVRSGLVRPDRLAELVSMVPAEKPFIDRDAAPG